MRTDRKVNFEPAAELGLNLPGRRFQDGVSQSGHERNHLFLNGQGSAFRDVSALSGLDHPADGRAVARFDLDHDGLQDLAVVNANAPLLQIFRNQSQVEPTRFVALQLEGSNHAAEAKVGRSSRNAIGAQIEVHAGSRRLLRELRAGEGLAAQNSATLVIGLGAASRAERVLVRWPSGNESEIEDVPAGTLLRIREVETGQAPQVTREAYGPPATALAHPEPAVKQLSLGATSTGKLRLLTTMATWCEVCRGELPQVQELAEAFPDTVELVGIPTDPSDTAGMLEAWTRRHQPAYSLRTDLTPEQRTEVTSHVVAELDKDALPASIVTDANGAVLETRFGVPTVSDLRRILRGEQAKTEGRPGS